ncbi:hypothetical protein H4219_004508 [Mycoemilia scoparia]|uniref:polynucleotide adenylyltransferase n=1 Tax=Mycoemilia scoparia TaxID=417184 RepID=A0A9W7ZZK3_9FUNG|nr:hypothetical protein H4219_004508 [Mycoemilia scoparia]
MSEPTFQPNTFVQNRCTSQRYVAPHNVHEEFPIFETGVFPGEMCSNEASCLTLVTSESPSDSSTVSLASRKYARSISPDHTLTSHFDDVEDDEDERNHSSSSFDDSMDVSDCHISDTDQTFIGCLAADFPGAAGLIQPNDGHYDGLDIRSSKSPSKGAQSRRSKKPMTARSSMTSEGSRQHCLETVAVDGRISNTNELEIGMDCELLANKEADPQPLSKELDLFLEKQILHLYDTVFFPTAESIESKRDYVEKLDAILKAEFPGQDIETHIFGSSVNGLGTSSSDVDICLTTGYAEIEDVVFLSKALRRHGIETVCIPNARVPIIKAWDPQLRIASDINVNNTIALYNTRMIQTFVAIDSRVKPFVMAIKNWAKSRKINDAAQGGTLSPYAWVNLALNFLQMRSPPILPVLHPPKPTMASKEEIETGRVDVEFNDDIDGLRGFGSANAESLGKLIYEFFYNYAYVFDYKNSVVSLRRGCYLDKSCKGWDTGRPATIMCIEEPFSTWLNLAHSASVVSVNEIRSEFRRAFRILNELHCFETACEPYISSSRPRRAPRAKYNKSHSPVEPARPKQSSEEIQRKSSHRGRQSGSQSGGFYHSNSSNYRRGNLSRAEMSTNWRRPASGNARCEDNTYSKTDISMTKIHSSDPSLTNGQGDPNRLPSDYVAANAISVSKISKQLIAHKSDENTHPKTNENITPSVKKHVLPIDVATALDPFVALASPKEGGVSPKTALASPHQLVTKIKIYQAAKTGVVKKSSAPTLMSATPEKKNIRLNTKILSRRTSHKNTLTTNS